MTVVYRFTRDLRLTDHAGLASAAAHGEILPVLVIDQSLHSKLAASPRRAAFYCAAVESLARALSERGTRLIVRRGKPGPVLRSIARATGAQTVAWSARFDADGMRDDQRLQSALEEAGVRALAVHDATAIGPEESTAARPSAGDGYRSFAAYFHLWRDLQPASYELPLLVSFAQADLQSEALPQPGEFGSHLPAAAFDRLPEDRFEAFLRGDAVQYAFALNSPADDRTSHLGADLSFGTISAREVVRRTKARIDDPFLLTEERASLKVFLRSVALRDFFLQLSWYNPETAVAPLQEKMRDFPFAQSHPALDSWRAGNTGYPIVDAGIRQLHATGWMHPRVRSLAASFLCFDLGVDWRIGMAEWERYLVEDEPALALGNWQWIAGVGADLAAYPRIYNPRKQAHRFDPLGQYAKKWIPELAHVPPELIGAASVRSSSQLDLPLFPENTYPSPVVDHEREARDFLLRYQRFTGDKNSAIPPIDLDE